MKNEVTLLETIADIAYAAGAAGYTSGDSRADVQEFIHLAKLFEVKWTGHNWNESSDTSQPDYMEAIDKFVTDNLRFVNKLDFNYPKGLVEEWDNLEIAACKHDGIENVYRLDDDSEEPDFWTVYAHMVEGGVMAIADVPTEKHATDLSELIHNAVISFKDNGFMALTRNKEAYDKFHHYINKRIDKATPNEKFLLSDIKSVFNDIIKS